MVTGSLGFSGQALVALLASERQHVVGLDVAATPADFGSVVAADLRSRDEMMQAVQQVRPQYVVHLAAVLPGEDATLLNDVNFLGTVNLLDAVARYAPKSRICVVGSSAEYGLTDPNHCPLREDQPLKPLSIYGITKVAQGLAAQRAWLNDVLPVVRTRTFNLIGPEQPDSLAPGAFARQIAEAEAGLRDPVIVTGGLADYRDFVDVRDAVRAYWLLTQHGEAGHVYNVCSGHPVQVSQILELLIESAACPLDIRTRADAQESPVPYQYGSHDLLSAHTGWQPRIALEQSVQDLLDYWRRRIQTRKSS